MKITIGGIKGGSGKSTLATNLAVIYATRGLRVLLVDTDEQNTSYDFTQLRIATLGDAGYTCTKQHGSKIHHALKGFQDAFDIILIDTGGRESAAQRAALLGSDLVVFPFVPRAYDLWTLEPVSDLLETTRLLNTSLRALAFINRADRAGHLLRETEAMLAAAAEHGIDYTELRLHTRVAFGSAQAVGLAATELKPLDPKADTEIRALADLIFERASQSPTPEVHHASN